MRLSWNEVRVRAATFADEWSSAVRETSETHSFYNAFFRVFGVERRSVARYEEHVAKLDNSSGFIDLFWPGVLIVEQKSAGRDLSKAYGQAGEYFDALKERDRPRYMLVSDFQTFELHDLDERTEVRFSLKDLPAHVEHFGFILGVQRRTFRDQDPANIKAAELVGRLHDALHAANYRGHDLERFLVRIVFCLFADDTGIFEPRDIFLEFIETRTSQDGADLGPWLRQVFEVLNSPEEERSPLLDEDLARFPYVNGDLFREHLRTPSFNSSMREALLDVCRFDWSNISPAIFGALFQSVMEPEQRRAQGAHYTTEKNILKVIEPLFMDDLREEFERLKSRKDSRRRAEWPKSTLANLYDPELMPPNLRCAHQALDRTVDRLYRRTPFASERDRIEHLFTSTKRFDPRWEPTSRHHEDKRRSADSFLLTLPFPCSRLIVQATSLIDPLGSHRWPLRGERRPRVRTGIASVAPQVPSVRQAFRRSGFVRRRTGPCASRVAVMTCE